MGMFDNFHLSSKCPYCNIEIKYWQTKDLQCQLDNYNIFSKEFNDIDNFYTPCDNCNTWIEYIRSTDDNNIFFLTAMLSGKYHEINIRELKLLNKLGGL